MTSAYTPNTSIALRDVVQVEHKPIPFLTYPHFDSSLHVDRPHDSLARKSVDLLPSHDIVVSLSEPYLLRAPRISHPDVCREYGIMEKAVQPPSELRTVAERLAITPPLPLQISVSEPPSPTARAFNLASPSSDGYSLPPSPLSPSFPPSPVSPLSPSRASPYPFQTPAPYPQDYPSPPERSLSPLRFASPDLSQSMVELGLGLDDDPMPMVYAFPRDKYTRMVRSARSKSKARRTLFDERGVALMWGLHDDSQSITELGTRTQLAGMV